MGADIRHLTPAALTTLDNPAIITINQDLSTSIQIIPIIGAFNAKCDGEHIADE